jgi:hypothetical protein
MSLSKITTGHSVFENDQVLMHHHLNGLVEYADDQARLSRVKLVGVGVLDGMRPRQSGEGVRIGVGVGVTTDGDLLYLEREVVHTHFRRFDAARFSAAGQLSGVSFYELLRDDAGDALAWPLAEFEGSLSEMVVLAYMESYVESQNLCSATECDKLGKHARNEQRFLLVSAADVAALASDIPTLHDAYERLPELHVERPRLVDSWTSSEQLAASYREVCAAAYCDLVAAFGSLASLVESHELGDIIDPAEPAKWAKGLEDLAIRWSCGGKALGIQYYYDLLRDLVDTWNGFRAILFGDRSWLHTSASRLSKHLLLGSLDSSAAAEVHRTAWFPASLLHANRDTRGHAGMLLRKIGRLIAHFHVDTGCARDIRITPSATDDHPLEDRAIPIYYPNPAIKRGWSHSHDVRGSSDRILSYHSVDWSEHTPMREPQLARFSFFRVEGHIGHGGNEALEIIRAQIATRNLPFSVRLVSLDDSLARKLGSDARGIEHLGGVERGGTFILVRDGSGIVVADFAVPWQACPVEDAGEPGNVRVLVALILAALVALVLFPVLATEAEPDDGFAASGTSTESTDACEPASTEGAIASELESSDEAESGGAAQAIPETAFQVRCGGARRCPPGWFCEDEVCVEAEE